MGSVSVWVLIIVAVAALILGLFGGFIFYKKISTKRQTLAAIVVVQSDNKKDPPYVYLEFSCSVDEILLRDKMFVDIKHISHK